MGRFAAAAVLSIAVLASSIAGCSLPALAPGTQACVGLPVAKCQALISEFQNGRALTATAFSIRCVSASCTEQKGEAEVTITWSDGTTETAHTLWDVVGG